MRNQQGEITLFGILMLVVLSGVLLLCSLELQKSFSTLKRRTHLFLCVKETKGEFHHYMKNMGRTNWAIKNITRASVIMIFIPGLQGAAMDADKLKRYIKNYQNSVILISYLEKLHSLKQKGCPLDPRMFITPFERNAAVYRRDRYEAAQLRRTEWSYYFLLKPYLLELRIKAADYEQVRPQIQYTPIERLARLSSLSSYAF